MSQPLCERCALPHPELVECTDAQKQIMIDLLYRMGDESKCDGCGARIFWLRHKNGKKAPYTVAGLNHFVDCPAREQFQKKAAG